MNPSARSTRAGQTLTNRTWALIEDAGRAAGVPIRVVQGSWSRGSLSAGTHTGGGVFDLSVRGMTEAQQLRLVDELRRRNCAAWLRSRRFGWRRGDHIHALVLDDPTLSRTARAQAAAFRAGRDGLAGWRRDPFPRPPARPFEVGGGPSVILANLRFGARNTDVRDLQAALGITVDGYYGPATDAAVRAHQKRLGQRPDPKGHSFVGPAQAKALGLRIG